MDVNNGKYSRKETSRELLKEMTYLLMALCRLAMIAYGARVSYAPRSVTWQYVHLVIQLFLTEQIYPEVNPH